jgi:hypothetical protein
LTAILLSAAATCVASIFLGQAALRLAGARQWSWAAPLVGLSITVLVSAAALHLPGRSATTAALLGLLTVAAAVWCLSAPAHRMPLTGLLAALPVAAMVLIPFLSAGRAGILGTTVNNDMAVHLWWAEAFVSPAAAAAAPLPPDYPLGPHAAVASLAKGLGIGVEGAFAGWTMALPILSAWTALLLARRASWPRQVLTATVVGAPFLIAAYYGQGSFKEVLQAALVLAAALLLSGYGPALGRGRWVPLALIVAGMMSVYSVTGLPWPVALLGVWAIVEGGLRVRRDGIAKLRAAVVRELPAIGIGCAVLVVSLIPQLSRLASYVAERQGTGIPKDSLGNLVGPVPGWEAFGIWSADFRLPATPAFTIGMWTALALAMALLGAFWGLRRGRWMLVLAAVVTMSIWAFSAQTQSPYVAAKALVIASPLVLALAVLPLVEAETRPRSLRALFERAPGQLYSWGLAALLGLVLLGRVGLADVQALRASPIGPLVHADELRSLSKSLQGKRTLFLGSDVFINWELPGVPVWAPILGAEARAVRPQKQWTYGQALDFDSVDSKTLNGYRWVITTRDTAGSEPPPQLHLVKRTPSYELWQRTGRVRPRSILTEGELPGALLDCGSPAGRKVLRGGGVAAIRPAPVVVTGITLSPGETRQMPLPLGPGKWDLATPYTSPNGVSVRAPGLRASLPPNLDAAGPRWPIGRLTVGDRPVALTLETSSNPLLAPPRYAAALNSVVATRVAPERVVPVRRACGRYVDWYRSAADRSG